MPHKLHDGSTYGRASLDKGVKGKKSRHNGIPSAQRCCREQPITTSVLPSPAHFSSANSSGRKWKREIEHQASLSRRGIDFNATYRWDLQMESSIFVERGVENGQWRFRASGDEANRVATAVHVSRRNEQSLLLE